jgi:hypothetical protein
LLELLDDRLGDVVEQAACVVALVAGHPGIMAVQRGDRK